MLPVTSRPSFLVPRSALSALSCLMIFRSPAYELSPCPVCGTQADEEIAGPDDVRAEVEALWEFHTRRLRPDTPPAHLTDRIAFSQHPPLRVARCTVCGLVYRNPRERAHALRDVYAVHRPRDLEYNALCSQRALAHHASTYSRGAVYACYDKIYAQGRAVH